MDCFQSVYLSLSFSLVSLPCRFQPTHFTCSASKHICRPHFLPLFLYDLVAYFFFSLLPFSSGMIFESSGKLAIPSTFSLSLPPSILMAPPRRSSEALCRLHKGSLRCGALRRTDSHAQLLASAHSPTFTTSSPNILEAAMNKEGLELEPSSTLEVQGQGSVTSC